MDYFCRSGALLEYPELVRSFGQNPSALLQEVGLSTAVLHDSELYLPYKKFAELLTVSAARCTAPDFGVCLGSRQGLQVPGALSPIMCMQATMQDALRLMQRNLDFHARGVQIDVEHTDATVGLRLSFAFAHELDCEQLSALSVTLLCQVIAQLHGSQIKPLHCEFWGGNKAVATRFGSVFDCPVEHDAGINRVSYPATILNLPINVAPELRARLGNQWRSYSAQHTTSLIRQVERAIAALLPTGECSLDMVAKLVERQPRSLQNDLKRENTTFGAVLQQTRLRLACQYLRSSDIDLTTLAMNLGFAELAVFSRAFKHWTGIPPKEWRQRAARGKETIR